MDFTAPLNISNKGHKVSMAFKNKDRGRIDFIEGKLKKNQLVIEVAYHFDSY